MMWKAFIALILVLYVLGMVPVKAQEITGEQSWDLKDIEQTGLFIFYDAPAEASSTGKPLDVGDFNGDGCGDIAAGGSFASFGGLEGWRREAGHVRIIMDLCEIAGRIAMEEESEQSSTVITVYGARAGDMAGIEVFVGDFNADGYDDVLFGAQNYDGEAQNRSNAGAAYLALGNPNFANGDIDLLNPPNNVIVFYGGTAEDRFGLWVDGGDFNGDGFDDLLIGANQADGENDSRINAGEAWIIYGSEDMVEEYGSVVDMSQPPTNATRIIGVDYDDLFGSTALGADINADGYDDAIVSAALWRESAGIGGAELGGGDGPDNRRYNSGETFVIYGQTALPGRVIDLAAIISDDGSPTNDSITVIYGVDPNDLLGEEIAAGDINGDGRNELALGTLVSAGLDNVMPGGGESWLIYTTEPFMGEAIDLLNPESERAVSIYADQADSESGDILRFTDLDQDGYEDLFVGTPSYDVTGTNGEVRQDAGMLTVLFGGESGLPNDNGRVVFPSNVPPGLRSGYILGADAEDEMAYGLGIYDVDADGFVDIVPNGMLGDGINNTLHNAGEVYVISGALFLERLLANPINDE
jgi:hypothetical protein